MINLFALLSLCHTAAATPNIDNIQIPNTEEHQRWNMAPRETRAGFLRFVGSDIESSDWTPFYLTRFFDSNEPIEIKLALLDLIERSEGEWQMELFDHYQHTPHAAIRRAILEMTRRLPIEKKEHLIRVAANDSSPIVRAAAMREIARCPNSNFSKELSAGLNDTDADVLKFAARTAGWRKNPLYLTSLEGLLAHSDNEVRFQSFNALKSISHQRAKELAVNHTNDNDKRINRLARKILTINK